MNKQKSTLHIYNIFFIQKNKQKGIITTWKKHQQRFRFVLSAGVNRVNRSFHIERIDRSGVLRFCIRFVFWSNGDLYFFVILTCRNRFELYEVFCVGFFVVFMNFERLNSSWTLELFRFELHLIFHMIHWIDNNQRFEWIQNIFLIINVLYLFFLNEKLNWIQSTAYSI